MCIIIYKPQGAKKPSEDLLRKAHFYNPDGCGLCTPEFYYKGLSLNTLLRVAADLDEEQPVLFHFRYATTGSIKNSNCHPFYNKETDTFFMHNGIINITPTKDITDSQYVFENYLVPAIKRYGIESREFEAVESLYRGGSRFAYMQGDNVFLRGNFSYRDGLYFSNDRLFYGL